MKQNYLIGKLILIFVLFLTSCKKNEVTKPSFEVKTSKTTVKVGELTSFTFEGNPDFISFYSGQVGNDYAYKDGRVLEVKGFNVSFQSRVTNGAQPNQLSVHISSDFNGKFDIENVKAATWKDITSSFTLATADYINSGEADLTSAVADRKKPFYIAFRCITLPQTTTSLNTRTWAIRNFLLNTKTDVGVNTSIDQLTGGWTIVEGGSILESGRNLISASTGALTLRGNVTAAGKLITTEAWAISQAVDLNIVNLGPDLGTPIKGISETMPAEYNYAFTAPGTYKVTFKGSNTSVYGEETVLKEVIITVVP